MKRTLWYDGQINFPVLVKLAQKYLCVFVPQVQYQRGCLIQQAILSREPL